MILLSFLYYSIVPKFPIRNIYDPYGLKLLFKRVLWLITHLLLETALLFFVITSIP